MSSSLQNINSCTYWRGMCENVWWCERTPLRHQCFVFLFTEFE